MNTEDVLLVLAADVNFHVENDRLNSDSTATTPWTPVKVASLIAHGLEM